jgi:uncharacterized membrane protein
VNPFGSNGSMPATNLSANSDAFARSATSIGFQGASGQVNTASYNDNGTGMAQVVTAASMENTAFDSSGRMEVNSNDGEGANLQWTGK